MTGLLLRRKIARAFAQLTRCHGLNEFEGHFKIRWITNPQCNKEMVEIHYGFWNPGTGTPLEPRAMYVKSDWVDGSSEGASEGLFAPVAPLWPQRATTALHI